MSKMFVHYSGTIEAFRAAGLETTYNKHIVFIKGGENGTGAAVYTHGQYYGNVKDALAALQTKVDGLKYFSKISNGTSTAAAGGAEGTITIKGEDPSVVTVAVDTTGFNIGLSQEFKNKVSDNTTAIANEQSRAEGVEGKLRTDLGTKEDGADSTGSAFARIAQLQANIDSMTGGNGSISEQISAAIKLLDVETIAGDYVASISQEDGKIKPVMGTFNFDTKGAAAAAESAAKAYADGLATNYDAAGAAADALEAAKTYADGERDAAISAAAGDATSKANAAEQAAKNYADSLAGNYDAAGSAEDALTDAKAYTDEKVQEINTAAGNLEVRVKANEDAIGVLNGEGEGSVKKSVADAIASVVASAPEDFDTLKEVADWIGSDTTGAAQMQADIATLKGADTVEGSVAKTVKDAVAAEAEIARAAEDKIEASVGLAEDGSFVAYTDKHYINSASSVRDEIVKLDAALDGYVGVMTHKFDYFAQENINIRSEFAAADETLQGEIDAAEGRLDTIEADYLKAADKTELQGAIDDLAAEHAEDERVIAEALTDLNSKYDSVVTDYAAADATTLASAKTYTNDEIAKLDVTDTAVENQFVTAVSETDGKISVSRSAINASQIGITNTDTDAFAAETQNVQDALTELASFWAWEEL